MIDGLVTQAATKVPAKYFDVMDPCLRIGFTFDISKVVLPCARSIIFVYHVSARLARIVQSMME